MVAHRQLTPAVSILEEADIPLILRIKIDGVERFAAPISADDTAAATKLFEERWTALRLDGRAAAFVEDGNIMRVIALEHAQTARFLEKLPARFHRQPPPRTRLARRQRQQQSSKGTTMALFSKAEVTSSYLKMGMMGFAGSGKTYTATSVAIGLHRLAKSRKPIFFLDTEQGSDWVKPRIEAAGIQLFTAKTRAFRDLLDAVPEAENNASLLLVDSLTHFWVELTDAYMRKKNRTRLQFDDWAFLKGEWRKFTDLFINSNLHIIVCGRAGFEYDYATDEETGKKQLEKTGIKMKAEGEMGYEPSLLVLMEREMEMASKTNKHFAKVLKDRSTLLDGKEFADPTFDHFLPHIKCLNLGGRQLGVDTTRTSVGMIPADIRDNRSTQRKIALGEIEEILVRHYPGQTAADKKAKAELLRAHFKACWAEIESVMPLEQLREGYDTLHIALEGEPSRYHRESAPEMNDELPDHSAPPVAEPKAAIDLTDVNGTPAFLKRKRTPKTEATFEDLVTAE